MNTPNTLNTLNTPLVLGLDLGGTKSAALVLTASGETLCRVAEATPAGDGPTVIVPFLLALARRALGRSPGPVAGVGVSAGAPASARSGRVFSAPNLPGWGENGVPLARLLSQELNGLPVALDNDANATALAEHRFGAGRGARDMAFLTVGTGIGAGLILADRLYRGAGEAAGEIGHVAVETDPARARACACGLRGCLEAYTSGPSLVRVAVENGWAGEPSGPAVVAAARAGDAACRGAVDQAGAMLGRGIAALCMITNPERVVLGTLAVHAADLLLPTIERVLRERCWPRIHENVRIVPAALGDRAQDLAALCVWLAAPENEKHRADAVLQ